MGLPLLFDGAKRGDPVTPVSYLLLRPAQPLLDVAGQLSGRHPFPYLSHAARGGRAGTGCPVRRRLGGCREGEVQLRACVLWVPRPCVKTPPERASCPAVRNSNPAGSLLKARGVIQSGVFPFLCVNTQKSDQQDEESNLRLRHAPGPVRFGK